MRRFWKRLRRKRVLIPGGILAGLLLVLAFLVSTTSGARWLLGLALGKSPVPVTIAHIEGRLLGPLHLYDIDVRYPLAEVTIGHVELDWKAIDLFSRRLTVKHLIIEDVNAELTPPEQTETTEPREPREKGGLPPPVEIPLDIVIDNARLVRVRMLVADAVELADLHFSLQGRADDYDLSLSTRILGEKVPPSELELEAQGSLRDITVDSLVVRTLEGEIISHATASWYPEIAWQMALRVAGLQPGALAPQPEQWAGQVSLELRSEGRLDPDILEPQGWAALDTLTGELRGEALSGRGRAEFSGARRARADLTLGWSGIAAALTAAIGDSLAADLHLVCADLGQLAPDLGGDLVLDVVADGTLEEPRVVVDLAAHELRAGPTPVRVADLAGRLAATGGDEPAGRLDLRLDRAELGAVSQDSTVVTLVGDRQTQSLHLATTGPQLAALITVVGTLDADSLVWSGTLDTLTVRNAVAGEWSLRHPTLVTASATAASLDSFRLAQGDAELQLGGAWADSTWSAHGAVIHLPLALANAGLPEPQTLGGSLEAEFVAEGDLAGAFAGRFGAALADARLHFALADVPDSLLIEDTRVEVIADAAGVHGEAGLTIVASQGAARATLNAEFALSDYTSYTDSLPPQPLTATLTGSLPDLGVFEGLSPLVRDLQGSVGLDASVAGTVAAPEITGELRATGGAVTMPDLEITVSDIVLVATGDPTSGLNLEGGARSGEGSLAITGTIPPRPSAATPVKVAIQGERFQVMNTPEIEVEIQPDLTLDYDGEKLLVGGSLELPKVLVELVEVPESAMPVSPDVVVVDQEEPPPPLPVDTWVEVQVVLGEEVIFRGFAMSIQLEGSLRVEQHVPEPPLGHGDIRIVEGYYRAYGQDLTIDEGGVISFAGPVENPGINIRAYRETADGVIAGVHITGTAEYPELAVYSEPAMTQTEAISYLLTGRPLDAGSGDDKAKVAGTAALLGGNVLSSQLGNKVGLDEARIETDSTLDEASLVTGKYLSPHIYLAYTMGLFDRTNLVRVRYIFSPKWAVQAETGTTMGTDIFYKIERGGD